MSTWRDDYYAALGVRDVREKANSSLYDAYTRLADRVSQEQPQQSPEAPVPRRLSKPTVPFSDLPSLSDALAAARKDLAEAQRSRTDLLAQLKKTTEQLETAKKKAAVDNKKVIDLSVERTQLQQRLKDRDEELRGKAKLLDDVQSELASLNLQFNMSEDRAKVLEKENKELIDRWMARMGQEAEAMNKASKFS